MTERRYDPNNPKRVVPAEKPRRVVLPGSADESPAPLPPAAVAVSKGPEWHNRRDVQPSQIKDKRMLVERAVAEIPGLAEAINDPDFNGADSVVTAVIIAQALDRLGERIIEASVLSR